MPRTIYALATASCQRTSSENPSFNREEDMEHVRKPENPC